MAKTNGFNLEQVAFQDTDKIRLLISFVIVAYILAIEQGHLQEKHNPVRQIRSVREEVSQCICFSRWAAKTQGKAHLSERFSEVFTQELLGAFC